METAAEEETEITVKADRMAAKEETAEQNIVLCSTSVATVAEAAMAGTAVEAEMRVAAATPDAEV